MANRFLSNININDEYTLPSADGSADQIIQTDGAGNLTFVDPSVLSVGESEQVHIACKNTSGVAISKGDPVYITGTVGTSFRIQIAKADASDSAKMPAVGLAETDLGLNAEGFVIVSGVLKNLTTDPLSTSDGTPSSNDTVYVKAGGGLTKTRPTGSGNLIQNVGKVGRVNSANAGSLAVSTIMRTNDVPNLTTGKIWVGSPTYTTESTVVHLDEANGKMGIGTTSPVKNLNLQWSSSSVDPETGEGLSGGASGKGVLLTNSNVNVGTFANLDFRANNADARIAFTHNATNNGDFHFILDNTTAVPLTRLFIEGETGNVGIGTTSPGDPLTVVGKISSLGGTNNAKNVKIYANDSFGYLTTNASKIYMSTQLQVDSGLIGSYNEDLQLQVSGSTKMYINSSDNVGIGTTSPTSLGTDITTLDIQGSSGGGFRFGTTGGVEGGVYTISSGTYIGSISNVPLYLRTNNSTKATILANGNVGIGTTSPSEKLEVAGNARITGDVTLSNGNALRWTSDDVRIEGTTAGDNIKFYVANTEILQLAQSGTLATVTGNLRVTGGDITLDGTGRIQGIDTVSAGTDAVNKNYVDTNFASSSHTHSEYLLNNADDTTSGSLAVGSTSSTSNKSLKVLAGDSYIASIEAMGGSQGTGKLYVGQASNYGGGIMYNGDDNPNLPQTSDAISFYRRSNDVETEVFRYPHNSSVVTFNDDIVVSGGDITLGGTGRIQGVDTVSAGTDAANKTYVDNAVAGVAYTHPTHPGDDINLDTGALTGATVISDLDFNITTDTLGHVTDANATYSTRNLTASDVIVAPNAPTNLTTTIVNSTIDVTFTASTTSGIDYYLVFSSVDGGDYGLISVIPPDDFGATMSIIDDSFDASGTQAYRVYAVKYGVYSSALTGNISYSVTTPLEPTNMSVVNLNTAYYVQWDPPSANARFVTAYNVYKHEHATQGSLSRSSATLVYSGMNTSYMYQISGNNNLNYHQFWVETTIA